MTEHEGEAYQDVLANTEAEFFGEEDLGPNLCCVCGEQTWNEPDQYGDIYCSPECWSKDTGRPISCVDCGQPLSRCDCFLELFE